MSELTPYICVGDCRAAIAWYVDALGAELAYDPIVMDDGRVGHCELAVDGARWMMSDAFESAGVAPPAPDRGPAVTLHLTVPDCDAAAARVNAAGVDLREATLKDTHLDLFGAVHLAELYGADVEP